MCARIPAKVGNHKFQLLTQGTSNSPETDDFFGPLQVYESMPVSGERYVVKVEPEEMSGFRLWETFQCCSGVPVGWENAE